MRILSPQVEHVMKHPAAFALQVIKAFRANQGMLLAGAVAYYVLLSMIPMLILMVIALSHVIGQAELLAALRRALEWLAPGQSGALSQELTAFLAHQEVLGWVLAVTMLFFSSQAFTVLESAISVIFLHRVTKRPRPVLASYVLIPLGYILVIGAALLVGTMVLADVVAIGEQSLVIMGHSWSLGGPSRFLLYLAGVVAEILLISSIYYFMPVGRLSPHRALIGGTTAGLLWEIIRHVLGWYFTSLSQVNVVYGSLTTAVVVLLSLEIAAALLLLGAQVIAEYENIGTSAEDAPPVTLKTEAVKDKT